MKAEDVTVVTYLIRPITIGDIDMKVVALPEGEAGDAVIKKLKVKVGILIEFSFVKIANKNYFQVIFFRIVIVGQHSENTLLNSTYIF